MDPTLRAQIRGFLSQDEVVERVLGDEDVHEALLELVKEPPLHPHVVHVAPTFVDEDQSYYEGDKLVKASAKVRQQVVNFCPDCGLGLTSRGFDMICPRLSMNHPLRGHDEHPDVIACGLGSTDG